MNFQHHNYKQKLFKFIIFSLPTVDAQLAIDELNEDEQRRLNAGLLGISGEIVFTSVSLRNDGTSIENPLTDLDSISSILASAIRRQELQHEENVRKQCQV